MKGKYLHNKPIWKKATVASFVREQTQQRYQI